MSKRLALLVAGWTIVSVIVLITPSFTVRSIFAILTLTLFALVLWHRRSSSGFTEPHVTLQSEQEPRELQGSFPIETLFGATIESMREGLLVVDRDMRVVASNPAAYRLFGPAPRKLNNQRLTELTRNPAIYKAFLGALEGIEHNTVKVEMVGPDRMVFELRVIPLSTNGTGSKGALGVFVDITRTERLELVRKEFLSNVSHELRTPLTAILAFVETLENGALEDQESSRRFLSIIRKNASRMHGLIDDILELTAIEGGNVQLRPRQVELKPLIDEAISSLAAKAEAQRVIVTNEVPKGVQIYADARRFERMLTNLIDNGIKFSQPGGRVTITHEVGDRDQIIVEDEGEGIPMHHLERIFERFYRVDRARSSDMGGTGLGLAIVKHLALLHGGEVTVTSELGRGTKFTIHLPRSAS